MTWKTGTPARSNSVSAPGSAPAGEGGCGDDERRREFARVPVPRKPSGGRILQAGDEDRDRPHAFARQCCAQRIDRRDIGGEQHRAVEEDAGRLAHPATGRSGRDLQPYQRCLFRASHRSRPSAPRYRLAAAIRLMSRQRASRRSRRLPYCPVRLRGNRQAAPSSSARGSVEAFDQPLILVAAFAGQQGQLDASVRAPGRRAGRSRSATIHSRRGCAPARSLPAPPRCRSRDRPTSDGAVRASARAAARAGVRPRLPGGGKACQVAVGKGQRHNIGRRLRRSTGSTRSSSVADDVARMCTAA